MYPAVQHGYDCLPVELWLYIVEQSDLEKTDLANISLVCRSFCVQARVFVSLSITRRIRILSTEWPFWQDKACHQRMLERLKLSRTPRISSYVKWLLLCRSRRDDNVDHQVPH